MDDANSIGNDIFDVSNSQFALFHFKQAADEGDIQKALYFYDCWYLEPGLIRVKELPLNEGLEELAQAYTNGLFDNYLKYAM